MPSEAQTESDKKLDEPTARQRVRQAAKRLPRESAVGYLVI